MKYIVVIGDGMADLPIKALGGKTVLEAAEIPFMDYIAKNGIFGTVKNVPDGMVPESDTANLAVLGYDPAVYSKGRSPLEALSMGIDMKPDETAVRANLVALSDNGEPYEAKLMLDHSSDEIPTEQSRVLMEYCDKLLCKDGQRLYAGVSYRNCLIYRNAPDFRDFARPHDIIGKPIGKYLPSAPEAKPYSDMMKASFDALNNHPLNLERAAAGLKKANSLWFWSPGKKPSLPLFKERTGLKGSVICAVDLIKGIGRCAGMRTPFVPGATGGCVTDYTAKAEAALAELKSGSDLVYIHVEAPDECGHKGDVNAKLAAVENIDSKIIGRIMTKLDSENESYRIMVLPDHPTPISVRSHTSVPVPFAIYSSEAETVSGAACYSEAEATATGLYIDDGSKLIDMLVGNRSNP